MERFRRSKTGIEEVLHCKIVAYRMITQAIAVGVTGLPESVLLENDRLGQREDSCLQD